ncbi:MAG: hypothetical protein KXJ61_02815 [Hydrogenophaga sp.]|jgi:hypothetical protein|uniref:hypothetical protein n=1 Tax=Hydrogenophaga sp. TaxID=1904254 RepID=UPI001DBC7FED|nr:hypothetical protein [Hydrogenophaga sp.]MBW0169136.1 hypothetical protein [Hydrogenophaga sp.]MBW0183192.1 hypothetical protein [Hydrogenophaga sp.]
MSLAVPGGTPRWSLFAWCVLPILSACNPTFNWRELRPEGSPLQALMPCKPESAARPVPLDGRAPVELHMHSCDAGGLTFAVAWAELDDEARVSGALTGWRRASLAAVRLDPSRGDDPTTRWNAAVPGATQAQGLMAQGSDHQGRAVQVRAVHFARGAQVFQAAVYGQGMSDEVTATFFEGLKLP